MITLSLKYEGEMINKYLLAGMFLLSGMFANGKLQERLLTNDVKISVIKQNVKTGSTISAHNHCKFCNKDCRKT